MPTYHWANHRMYIICRNVLVNHPHFHSDQTVETCSGMATNRSLVNDQCTLTPVTLNRQTLHHTTTECRFAAPPQAWTPAACQSSLMHLHEYDATRR